MAFPIRILLQTTIEPIADDWNIGRLSMLRDRAIDRSDYDELWLFAVDTGDGLDPENCAAIGRFRKRGGGLLVTRDHMDLVSWVCNLGGVGNAHFFHRRTLDPDEARRVIGDAGGGVDGPRSKSPRRHARRRAPARPGTLSPVHAGGARGNGTGDDFVPVKARPKPGKPTGP
jgi:hypothetical protein